ncbi:hypothetical protein LTS18_004818, partial [Coniosporium uncinatum]
MAVTLSSDPILDSPSDQRAQSTHSQHTRQYDTEEDSGDDIFEDHETIATLPVQRHNIPTQPVNTYSSSPAPYTTQPTQPLSRDTQVTVVQVPVSSPPPTPAPIQRKISRPTGRYIPPGCDFRPPPKLPAPSHIVDLDDDPPVAHQTSSEDELTKSRSDIKPTNFAAGGRSQAYKPKELSQTQAMLGSRQSSFGEKFMEHYTYDSSSSNNIPQKRAAPDDSISAYGNASKRLNKPGIPRQTGPARAQPVQTLTIEDVVDHQLRSKIIHMQTILPHHSVQNLRNALYAKRGNVDDAMDFIAEHEEAAEKSRQPAIVLSSDDDEKQKARSSKPTARREIKNKKTMQEKYYSTQGASKVPISKPPSADLAPAPKKGRLMQGRRHRTPEEEEEEPVQLALPERQKIKPKIVEMLSDESESGVDTDANDNDALLELEAK